MRERASGKYKYRRTINGESFFTSEGWGTPQFGKRYPKWSADRGLDPATGQARDLLDNAQKAGMGGNVHKVEGNASLGITLNGFPRGTKTDLTYSGLFKQYSLIRGQQMEAAEQK